MPLDGALRRSFRILQGIGPGRERTIWRAGILDWHAFLGAARVPGIPPQQKPSFDQELRRAVRAYAEREIRFFARRLPRSDSWRLLERFRDDAVALDIETDGRRVQAKVTVVGLARKGAYTALVADDTLTWTALRRELADARLLLTFNGSCFDLPVLQHSFPGAVPAMPHVDVRFLAKRAGFAGGLKLLERRLGFLRPPEVSMLTGQEAVYLWKLWDRDRRKRALELLLDYNRYDVLSLLPLAEDLAGRLVRQHERESGRATRATRRRIRRRR